MDRALLVQVELHGGCTKVGRSRIEGIPGGGAGDLEAAGRFAIIDRGVEMDGSKGGLGGVTPNHESCEEISAGEKAMIVAENQLLHVEAATNLKEHNITLGDKMEFKAWEALLLKARKRIDLKE